MKNTVKKIIALLLMTAMAFNALPFSALAETPNGKSNTVRLNGDPPEGIALTNIATVAVQSVTSGGTVVGPTGTVERDQQIGINISYSITDLTQAKANIPWVYDVSSYVGDDKIFSELLNTDNGQLINPTTNSVVGHYKVTSGGRVELYPDTDWLNNQGSGVAGSFSITAQLNETINKDKDENSFVFPGAASTTVRFLRKNIEADKYAYRIEGDTDPLAHAHTYDLASGNNHSQEATAGSVTIYDAGDGSYRLFYRIRVQVDAKPNDALTVTDVLDGGQALIDSTLNAYVERSSTESYELAQSFFTSVGDEGFTLNLKAALAGTFGDDTSKYVGKNIWIEYYTYLQKEDLKTAQTNSATVVYDSKTLEPSTSVTPDYDQRLTPFKWIDNDPHINTHIDGTGNEMTVGQDGSVYFLTGATLTSPATALSFTDSAVGVDIDPDSIKVAIGLVGNDYQGYEYYKDLKASGAYTANADGSFTFDVYKFIRYLVEDKVTNSEGKRFADLCKNYFYYDSVTNAFTLKPDVTFKVFYSGKAQEAYLYGENRPAISNTAAWESSYTTETQPATVGVTLEPEAGTIDKTGYTRIGTGEPFGEGVPANYADGSATGNQVEAGTWIRYELKVANKKSDGTSMDLAGYTVTDTINNYIDAVPKTIEIYNGAGDRIAVYDTESKTWTEGENLGLTMRVVNDNLGEGGWTANVGIKEGAEAANTTALNAMRGQSYDLFKLTFPTGQEFKDEYTIKYTVRVDDEMPDGDGIYGLHSVTNKGSVGIGDKKTSITVTNNVWFGFPSSDKKHIGWDKENNQAIWEVDVGLNGLESINRPLEIIEYYYSSQSWVTAGNVYAIPTSSISFEVQDEQGNILEEAANADDALQNQYVIQRSTQSCTVVFPKGINKNIKVIVRTTLDPDLPLKDQLEYHAKNTATVRVDGPSNSPKAEADYYDDTFEFSKDGSFGYTATEREIIHWTVELNPSGKTLKNNFKPVFRDTLPEGLKIEGDVVISAYLGKQKIKAFTIRANRQGQQGSFELNLIDLIDEQWSTIENATPPYAFDKPTGLSGWHFTIDYYTTLTQEEQNYIAEVQNSGKLEDITFTNNAGVYKENETTPLHTDSDTVQYEYRDLVSKEDVSAEDSGHYIQLLSYSVVINKNAQRINDGKWVRLSDQIPDNMELMLSEVKVAKGVNGSETDITDDPEQCSVSYSDSTRRLEISVPDETKAVVTFKARPIGGDGAYVNTVVLSGSNFSQTDTVEQDRKVSSAGTLTGQTNSVMIQKVDKYKVSQKLAGAIFEFYRCTVGTDGGIQNETIVPNNADGSNGIYTTDDQGMIAFTQIEPNTLYYWVETQAPENYIITSSVPKYFVAYQVLDSDNSVTVPWNKLSSATKEAIKGKFSGYTLIQSLDADDPTPVYISAFAPTASQENEYSTNEYCWLDSDYPANTGYGSLQDEVNAILKQEANDLRDLVNARYDGTITAVSVAGGYSWQVDNVKNDVESIPLEVTKKLVGRDMEVKEFTFYLYDETSATNNYLMQTRTSVAGEDGVTTPVAFDPITIASPGISKYRIEEKTGNADKITYDPTVYHFTVEAVRDEDQNSTTYGKLLVSVTSITKERNNVETDITDKGLKFPFINTYGTKELTGTKVWDDGGLTHKNKDEITLTLYRQSAKNGAAEETYTSAVTWNDDDYSYSGLPKYDDEGYEYTYWVTEAQVDGYQSPEYTNGDTGVTGKALDGGQIKNAKKSGVSLKLSGTKYLDGALATTAGQFTFTVAKGTMDDETAANVTLPEGTITNGADGSFITGEIKLKKDGVYKLVVKETPGNDGTIEYDGYEYTITVTVEETGSGYSITGVDPATETSTAGVYGIKAATGKSATFENATRKGALKLTKTVEGATLEADKTYGFLVSRTTGTGSEAVTKYYGVDANGKATAGTEEKQYVELTVPAGKKTASVTIDGLVIGTYDIAEADDSTYDADLTDYTLEVTGDETATVPYGGTGEAGITNTYTQDLPNVQVTKAFSGLTNLPDGFRITNDYDDTLVFTVGSAGMTGTGTTDDPYTWTIEKVPVDTVIVFTESGIQADGYILTVNGTVTSNATATATATSKEGETATATFVNKYNPKTSATVKKVWDDDGNRDSLRPLTLEVKLLADGAETGKAVILDTANNWTGRADGLPKFREDGVTEIEYTWKEADVSGYELTGTAKSGALTILTNTHKPETIPVSVKKIWVDNGTHPKEVKVQLFADGRAQGDAVALSEANGWKYSWDDLCRYITENGQAREIKYTVAEPEIPEGYTVKITGSASAGYVITNTLQEGSLIIEKQFDIQEPEEISEEEGMKTEIEVVKIWDDKENKDGNRPESITVHLFAGGEEVKTATLNAQNGWKKKWGDLPKFVDGHPIHYSVTEDPVQWYVPEIHGFTITNHYRPETTSVSVRKIWNDAGFESIRPKDILVKLNNGMCVILNEENGWFGTIAGLPTYVNGEPAVYTWSEPEVMGYTLESMVTEGNVTVITNKVWQREEKPKTGKKPKVPGDDLTLIDEYDTPLGVEVVINHVGDCFD